MQVVCLPPAILLPVLLLIARSVGWFLVWIIWMGKEGFMNGWKLVLMQAGVCLMAFVPSCMMVSSCATAYAATGSCSTEAENRITTGDVSISLAEYELDENGLEIPCRDGKVVLPGQRIDKVVRITNEGNDAWIRAKVEYGTEEGILSMEDCRVGIGPDWVRCGEYYYYEKPVAAEEPVDFFLEVTLTDDWGPDASNGKFQMGITAQAIQCAGFAPDFTSHEPWFGTPIEECVHSSHELYQASGGTGFTLVFENGVEGFIKSSENFFQGFSSMLPGDTLTGTLEFGSRFGRTLHVTFRSELPEGQPEESLRLLDELELAIWRDGEVLYEGPLSAEGLEDELVLIDALEKEQTQKIRYTLHMPEELNNHFALRQARVRWIFSARYHTSGSSGGSGSFGGSGSAGGSGDSRTADMPENLRLPQLLELPGEWLGQVVRELPELGDSKSRGIFGMVFFGSGAALVCLIAGRNGKRDGRKEDADE